eukprot:m.1558919 g.1558919  ORF g.1558919 m.1558919 type:complete len:306 (-) comp25274_c1_seq13:338-1255(-)
MVGSLSPPTSARSTAPSAGVASAGRGGGATVAAGAALVVGGDVSLVSYTLSGSSIAITPTIFFSPPSFSVESALLVSSSIPSSSGNGGAVGRFFGAMAGLSGTIFGFVDATVGFLGSMDGLAGTGAAGFLGVTAGFLGATLGVADAESTGDVTSEECSTPGSAAQESVVSPDDIPVTVGFAALVGGVGPLSVPAPSVPEPVTNFTAFTGGGGATLGLPGTAGGFCDAEEGSGFGSVLPAAPLSRADTDGRFFCTGGGTGFFWGAAGGTFLTATGGFFATAGGPSALAASLMFVSECCGIVPLFFC